jgi:hypothetical protein
MKKFAKVALSALLLAGAATAVASSPADARVVVGFGVGPGYYGYGPAYYPGYSCDPYSRWYSPYRCGGYYGPAYYGGYYGPSYYGPSIGFSFGGGGWGHGGWHGGHGGWGGGHHR